MANNRIKGLTVEIGGDTTKLGKALTDVEKKSRDLSGELGEINKLLKLDPGNADLLAQKQKVLAEAVETTAEKLKTLKEAEKQVQQQFKRGEVSEEQVRALQREIIETEKKMGNYKKAIKETAEGLDQMDDSTKKVEKSSGGLGSKLGGLAKAGVGALAAGVTAATGALIASAEASREYRTEMGKLDTAFTTAGHSSEAATKTYKALQGVLGETDQAVEAANHLAKLTDNEQDLQKWTDICTGVYATFGASLPIEGLTEAANETAKVGKVTGPLADALNWAGVSEDAFNESLAACSNEQERQTLIMETLSGLYDGAAEKYKETNAEVIRANQANEEWMSSMGEIGGVVEPLLTDIKLLGASLLSDLVPGIKEVAGAFRAMLSGDEGAAANLGEALSGIFSQLLTKLTEMLPSVAEMASGLITTLVSSILMALPQLLDQLPLILKTLLSMVEQAAQALATMLPILIPVIIDAVIMLAETLLDNVDMLIDAGIALLVGLADGLIVALPRLVEKIPVIIEKLVGALTRNLPKLAQSGKDLILKLATGLVQAIPQLVSKIPQIIKSIVSGLGKGAKDLATVGKDLIKGLWNGIKDMTSWITGKLEGFGKNVLSGIKSFFGIKSPSRVFRDEVGKMLAEGMAVGIEDNADAPLEAMSDLSRDLLGEADAVNGLTLERRLQHTFAAPESLSNAETGILGRLDKILTAIERGQILTLDGDTLVGGTADRMDGRLGQRRALVARGAV